MENIADSIPIVEPPGTLADMPRRQTIEISSGDSELPQMRFVAFPTNNLLALRRFFVWLQLLLTFAANTTFNMLRGRDNPRRRAENLRRAFERAGGSFVKLGIHLSMRLDLIPWVYSDELARMTDHMEPFPVEQAIAIIERTTKKPLSANFLRFDPQPIISSSVACTYQAVLRSGKKVAVKVRRPGIGERPGAGREQSLEFVGSEAVGGAVRPGDAADPPGIAVAERDVAAARVGPPGHVSGRVVAVSPVRAVRAESGVRPLVRTVVSVVETDHG